MKIRDGNWDRHLARAKKERVAGSTSPHENPSDTHKIWKVRNYKNNVPGTLYYVHIWWYGEDTIDARVSCTCYAGQASRECKHAAWVLREEGFID